MTAADVHDVIALIQGDGIPLWVDGGWGVDALVGWQTRDHGDLDLALRISDVPRVQRLLTGYGYEVFRDELPTRLELRDTRGHRVDLHPLTFDEAGNGRQELPGGRFATLTMLV